MSQYESRIWLFQVDQWLFEWSDVSEKMVSLFKLSDDGFIDDIDVRDVRDNMSSIINYLWSIDSTYEDNYFPKINQCFMVLCKFLNENKWNIAYLNLNTALSSWDSFKNFYNNFHMWYYKINMKNRSKDEQNNLTNFYHNMNFEMISLWHLIWPIN